MGPFDMGDEVQIKKIISRELKPVLIEHIKSNAVKKDILISAVNYV